MSLGGLFSQRHPEWGASEPTKMNMMLVGTCQYAMCIGHLMSVSLANCEWAMQWEAWGEVKAASRGRFRASFSSVAVEFKARMAMESVG